MYEINDKTPQNEETHSEGNDEYIFPGKIDVTDKEKKFRIMKNVLMICIAFLLNFTAFAGISNLQSSLNSDEGLGTTSLAIIYGALIVSALFVPTWMINALGCKWTLCISILGYVTYSIANFYPTWATLIPTSIIVGVSAAPLWAAKCAYLTTSAEAYAPLVHETTDAISNRFFGYFFCIFQMNQILGNLISSLVLTSANSTSLEIPEEYNETRIENYCGAADCQNGFGDSREEEDEIPRATIFLLMGIYTGCGLLAAALVAVAVDKITLRLTDDRSPMQLVTATFLHMKDKRQLMLIPLTMFSGFEQAFIAADFTKSYVTCPLAVNWVGFVMICYGAFDATFSFIFGRIEKYTGRIPLFTLAAVIDLGLIIALQQWVPYPSNAALFFVLPAFWGIADAVWQTQLNAFYGILFAGKPEESFSNYRLWESVGFVIAFGYQNYVCVYVKLYILLGMLILGMSFYYLVEYKEKTAVAGKVIPADDTKLGNYNTAYDLEFSNGSTPTLVQNQNDEPMTSL